MLTSIVGSHVTSMKYVSPWVAMINDTCQATADRHTERPVPPPTGGLLGVSSGSRTADRPIAEPRIRSGQTRAATTLNRTQMPIPSRQPPISAIGSANPDATAAVAPSTVEYRPVTSGTSVGEVPLHQFGDHDVADRDRGAHHDGADPQVGDAPRE